jgi:hypothetical protein
MHRKALFILAGVFLAVALAVPPIILIMQAETDVNNLIIVQNNPAMATSGNFSDPNALHQSHQINYLLVGIVEVVFVSLFAVTLYYALKRSTLPVSDL